MHEMKKGYHRLYRQLYRFSLFPIRLTEKLIFGSTRLEYGQRTHPHTRSSPSIIIQRTLGRFNNARRVDDAVQTRGIQLSVRGLAVEVKGKREKFKKFLLFAVKTSLNHAAGNSLDGDFIYRSNKRLR